MFLNFVELIALPVFAVVQELVFLNSLTLEVILTQAIPFPKWISDTAFSLGPVSVKWYGLGYVVGLFLALYYTKRTIARRELWQISAKNTVDGAKIGAVPSAQTLEDLMFYSLIGIIVGGRLGSVLLYNTVDYIHEPLRILKVWEGGMAFHGGFLGVCIAIILIARTRKIPLMRIADLAAISSPIGIGLVRLANFANQELYGRETDAPWAVIFRSPHGFDLPPRHPSQLYEAFLEGFVIFILLWILTRKFKALTKPGLCTGLFIFLYGMFRIGIEFVREPDAPLFGPLTRGISYSLPMVLIGAALIIWAWRRAAIAPEFQTTVPAKSAEE